MSSTTASQEELKAHRVPLAWRDQCSAYVLFLSARPGSSLNFCSLSTSRSFRVSPSKIVWFSLCGYPYSLLLPLNVCRKDKYYLPWECENERHAYEKCVSPCVVHLATNQQLLHGRCQYDEYVSSCSYIGPYTHLRAFISQLHAQNEGALKAETPREGSFGRFI